MSFQSSYDNHGHRLAVPPRPIESPRAIGFLFDGVKMTGFLPKSPLQLKSTKSSKSPLQLKLTKSSKLLLRDDVSVSSDVSTTSTFISPRASPSKCHQPTRRTFLSDVDKFSFSPGPAYNTFSTTKRGNAIVWHPESTSSLAPSPDITTPPPIRNIGTPSQTKLPHSTKVDWSTSQVPRFTGLIDYSTRPAKKRTVLPWGNPTKKMKQKPCVITYRRRFKMGDDRNSSIGGNFTFQDQETHDKVHQIEAYIRGMRENVWKTLRPRGEGLLDFPKTLHEKLAEKQQREIAKKMRRLKKKKCTS